MDKCMVTAKMFAKAQIEAGCDLIGMGNVICSQIDRDTYDIYVKDRHTELIAFIHECGAQVKLHICGNITHLLDSLRDVNSDIIDLDSQVDIDNARKILGPDAVIGGNINPVLIQEKTEAEVDNLSRKLVDKYRDQKYLLAGGCEITVLTPHENLTAMRKASIF